MRNSVITNSTPVIALAALNQLELLTKLFEKIYVTSQVYSEVVKQGNSKVGAKELESYVQKREILLYDVIESNFFSLMHGRIHLGEMSVIVAAKELGISYVLMDDACARKMAENFSLVPIGTVGILKLAKIKGILPEIKPLLDKLISMNFLISLKLYNEILKDVNEL